MPECNPACAAQWNPFVESCGGIDHVGTTLGMDSDFEGKKNLVTFNKKCSEIAVATAAPPDSHGAVPEWHPDSAVDFQVAHTEPSSSELGQLARSRIDSAAGAAMAAAYGGAGTGSFTYREDENGNGNSRGTYGGAGTGSFTYREDENGNGNSRGTYSGDEGGKTEDELAAQAQAAYMSELGKSLGYDTPYGDTYNNSGAPCECDGPSGFGCRYKNDYLYNPSAYKDCVPSCCSE